MHLLDIQSLIYGELFFLSYSIGLDEYSLGFQGKILDYSSTLRCSKNSDLLI